jgi:hypothetical protein
VHLSAFNPTIGLYFQPWTLILAAGARRCFRRLLHKNVHHGSKRRRLIVDGPGCFTHDPLGARAMWAL